MSLAVAIQPRASTNFQFLLKSPRKTLPFPDLQSPNFAFHSANTTTLKPTKSCASSSSLMNNKGGDSEEKQKLGVVVKPMKRARLVLKFMWMEKNIGIAIEQVIPGGHGTIPLSPYYFWPRRDAWEELKVMLERKPWISKKQMLILLNQATDIINLWQQTGGLL